MSIKNNQIIIYSAADGNMKLEVKLENETVWLSQKQMAELFDCSVDNIGLHLKNVYFEGELLENLTTEESSVVQKEGYKEVKRFIKIYNLDAIISVGYRINSLRGTQFRIWATQKLKEYIIKGFVLDDERLSDGQISKTYFQEDEFLIFNEKKILEGAGRVSHDDMEQKIRLELAKYNQKKLN
ncbi:MAG: RhuM family protein [Patescibacteria group bacterium]